MVSSGLKRLAEDIHQQRAEKRSKTQQPNSNENGETPETLSEDSFESWRFEKCEACFGVLEVNAMTTTPSQNGDLSSLYKLAGFEMPVKLQRSKNLAKMHLPESTDIHSEINFPVLAEISTAFKIYPCAFLVTKSQFKGNKNVTPVLLRVVIYGLLSEKASIGAMLSRKEIFLQHPFVGECDSAIPYENPHFFVRPGRAMPKLEDIAIVPEWKVDSVSNDALAKSDKSELLQIFEHVVQLDLDSVVCPSSRLKSKLKDHQLAALAFMVEKESGNWDDSRFPQLWTRMMYEDGQEIYRHIATGDFQKTKPKSIQGGILADEMGLGKTLSALALISWSLDTIDEPNKILHVQQRTTLIVTPKSTIPEWMQQIERHLSGSIQAPIIYHGAKRGQLELRMDTADVVLTTYDTLRSDHGMNGPLFARDWARVILDEAHTIRNAKSGTFRAACALRASFRWCLTGTPIQNSLDDFAALLTFLRIPPFCTNTGSFRFWCKPPPDNSWSFKQSRWLDRLRALVQVTCLRRTKASIEDHLRLPEKREIVCTVDLNKEERELYEFFRSKARCTGLSSLPGNKSAYGGKESQKRGQGIMSLIGIMRLICDHGEDILPQAARKAWNERDVDEMKWEIPEDTLRSDTYSITSEELENTSDEYAFEQYISEDICAGYKGSLMLPSPKSLTPETASISRSHSPASQINYKPSPKVSALLNHLKSNEADQSKSVVFSYWTRMLDLIQVAFQQKGIHFQRIDSQVTLENRMKALEEFNINPDCCVLLASIGSLKEGVNLTVASSVHIMEPQWNPMVEAQAVDRIHRIGQEKTVTVVRYFVNNSIESYVKAVQGSKLRLINQSLSQSSEEKAKMDNMLLEYLKA